MKARDNPFRTERLHSLRYRSPDGAGSLDVLERIAALNYRAAIVGPEGSGKTTLQEEIAGVLTRNGVFVRWLRLRRDNRHESRRLVRALFAELRPDEMLFVDGAEQLRWFTWRRVLRRAAGCRGLVITAHQPGRLPTAVECHSTPDLLEALAAEIIGTDAHELAPTLVALFTRHRGNLRLCFRELYDRWCDSDGRSRSASPSETANPEPRA